MKFIASLLLIGVLSALALGFLPWWCCGILACIIAYAFRLKPWGGLFAGFIGVALAWGVMAYLLDAQNQSILSARIGTLFMGMSSMALILFTAIIGGLSGALGGVTGAVLRR